MIKWKKLILPLLVFFALGFLRMHWSYQLNNIVSMRMYDMTMFPVSPYLSFLKDLSLEQVMSLKWAMTVFFVVLLCLVSIWMTRAVDYRLWRVIPGLYIGVVAISAASYLIGWMAWNGETGHNAARGVLEIAYTPLPALIIILFAGKTRSHI